jgi:hypothetical protein
VIDVNLDHLQTGSQGKIGSLIAPLSASATGCDRVASSLWILGAKQ